MQMREIYANEISLSVNMEHLSGSAWCRPSVNQVSTKCRLSVNLVFTSLSVYMCNMVFSIVFSFSYQGKEQKYFTVWKHVLQ